MIALLAAAWLAAPPDAKEEPRTVGAQGHELDDATRTDLLVDGPIAGWAIARQAEGRRRLYVLVGKAKDEDAPKTCGVAPDAPAAPSQDARLFAFDPSRPDVLSRVGEGLPEGTMEAADVDGDGIDEVFVFAEDGIVELVVDLPTGTTSSRQVASGSFAPVPEGKEDSALRAIAGGALTTLRRGAEGAVRAVGETEMPIYVDRRATGLRVVTPGVRPAPRPEDGRARFTIGPERHGVERVRLLVLDPDGPAEARVVEAWGRFPGRERALESSVVLLDGKPVLVVLTTDADKLSLFGEKGLRIFPLQADRTRAGVAPILAVETGINLWQPAVPTVLDLNADGRDDLVLTYWKGLKDAIAALEVRTRLPDGPFSKAKTFDFDVPDGDRGSMFYGKDLDGDGRPDLALRAKGSLLVYPGSPGGQAAEKPVAKTPSRRILLSEDALPDFTAQTMSFGPQGLSVEYDGDARLPRFIDLDGDGRVEGIFVGGSDAAGRVTIVRFR